MFDIKNLSLTIPGQFEDCFLYNQHLYLVDNTHLTIIDFEKLIEQISPKNKDQKMLFEFAFNRNDLFFEGQTFANTLLNLSFVRENLVKIFKKLKKISIDEKSLKKCIVKKVEHGLHGILHLEIYHSKIFVSNDKGVFVLKPYNQKIEKRSMQISKMRALHLVARYGTEIKFAAGLDGFGVYDFDPFKKSLPSLKTEKIIAKIPSIETEPAYQDFFTRDPDNKLSYVFNRFWVSKTKKRLPIKISLDLDKKYEVANLFDREGEKLLQDGYSTALNNRLLNLKGRELKLYKMNYNERENISSTTQSKDFNHFTLTNEFKITGDRITGKIYKTYQTLFGFFVETTDGLFQIDDVQNHRDGKLVCEQIINEPIFKIRHFYRAMRYSHILAIVKSNQLEIQADLTDYFFQKNLKKIRLTSPA